ncbi:hypothetical protein BVU17_09255 [Haloarcula taiwanensis]|uniref:Uncharacterized protein n=1 Tax=Haloarcula taiwanensis TaxID=1932004 RepID=A0A2H4ZYY2_9EURY|nr:MULTISPECIES: hypothetical protein [Haloarcula]AUG47694.1 hypothetical protein BVU17_09255 [Haloarcula taiwanensis]RLM39000.1 hypothetical protein DVK01_00110 [Haloarcula sp. Atlit-120R]RLM88781.1 hypothetical protein D3D01_20615 [Haloarcula sp. Atlit-7R]
MRERLRVNPFGVVAAVSVTLLCVLVAGAGAVAVIAQSVNTWRSLFLMEQAMAFLLPAVKVLLVVGLVASVGLVLRIQ